MVIGDPRRPMQCETNGDSQPQESIGKSGIRGNLPFNHRQDMQWTGLVDIGDDSIVNLNGKLHKVRDLVHSRGMVVDGKFFENGISVHNG